MFINPQVAIDEGWIKGIKDPEKQVQPNAIDFTIDTVYNVRIGSPFSIAEHGKVMRNRTEMPPVLDRATGFNFWRFKPMTFYDCLSNMYVAVPEGVVVLPLVARSSFTRNGVFLTSGFYDTGFEGHIGFVLNNMGGVANITQGTRIGQIAFVKADNAKVYSGGYSHGQGDAKALAADNWMQQKANITADRANRDKVLEALEGNTKAIDKQVSDDLKQLADAEIPSTPIKKTSKKRRPTTTASDLKEPVLTSEKTLDDKSKGKKKTKKKSTRGPAR